MLLPNFTKPVVYHWEDLAVPASAQIICKELMAGLTKFYPSYSWGLNVDVVGGVIIIFSSLFSYKKGYVLHISEVELDKIGKTAMRVGGEILERYNMTRRGFQPGMLREAPRDYRGLVISDDS